MSEFDGDQDSREERLLHEAEELMRQKRFQDAARRYQDLRSEQPTDLWASLGYASALECAGKISEAEQILDEVTVRHKRSAPLHRFRHLFFERREDLRGASQSQSVLESGILEEGTDDQLADLYFNQGRYLEALSELERLLKSSGDDSDGRASLLARIGACLRQTGDLEGARTRLSEALALDNDHHWTLSELAEAERALGDFVAAREHYHQALAAKPDDHWCRGHLAQMECEAGNIDTAIELYREILTSAPKTVWAMVELAQILTERDPVESQRLAQAALVEDGTYPWAHAQLGALARRAGRADEARDHLRRGLEASPDATWILHELADVCRQMGRSEEAHTHLERARNIDPYDATSYGYIADLLRHEGKTAAAVANLEKSVELDPEYTWAWRELAELRALAGKHEDADTAYRKAIELEPDEAINDGLKAFLLRCANKRDAAMPWLERAVERSNDYLWGWREIIDLHLVRGRPIEAEAAARRGLVALPESAPLLGLLAESLRRQGRHDDALGPVSGALDKAPEVPQLHALKAEILAEQGEHEAALPHARKAVSLDPSAEYKALLAQVLVAAGHLEEGAELTKHLMTATQPLLPAFELQAVLAERRDDLTEAMAWCDRAVSGPYPGEPRLLVRRARLGVQTGENNATDRLIPLLDQGVTLPWREVSQLFAQAGRPVLARRAAYQFIVQSDADGDGRNERRARAWLHLAELEMGMGNADEAQQALTAALSHDADCVPARILGAVLYEQRGDLTTAIAHLDHLDRRLHAANGDQDDDQPAESALLLRQLAALHERANNTDRAVACWTRILSEVGDDPVYAAEFASFNLRRNANGAEASAATVLDSLDHDLAEAQRLARELAIHRANRSGSAAGLTVLKRLRTLTTHNRLLAAHLALVAGDAIAARAETDIVLAAEPNNRTARTLRVRALIGSRDFAAAITAMRTVLAEESNDEEAATLLGEALAVTGHFDDAITALTAPALPSKPANERALLLACVLLEQRGPAAAIAALGRLNSPPSGPAGRVLASAWPTLWPSAAPPEPATTGDVLALPPFPAAAERLGDALASNRRHDLAAALALSAASSLNSERPDAARQLRYRAVGWLCALGDRQLAVRIAWQIRSPLALARALLWPL